MITVVAGGDSFTYGAELQDQIGHNASRSTIPALLANYANLNYVSVAVPGSSNASIARHVMNYCQNNNTNGLFVYVMWTFAQRYEFRFTYETGHRDSPWHNINMWDVNTPDLGIEELKSYRKHQQHLTDIGITDFAEVFYRHVGNSEYYELYTTLKEILFLQQYLKLNSVPYLFTTADQYFEGHDNYIRHQQDLTLSTIYNQIDWNNWYAFPRRNNINQTNHPIGFYQWATESKYSIGPYCHPLEQSHIDAAELIKDKFYELVKKSYQSHSLGNSISKAT